MSEINVKDMLEAGVHFGHNCARWNPKMRPYIYGRRNQIHIIDIKETIRGLIRAKKYLLKVAAQGGLILFVGTKRQAAASIEELATECRMPYCTERWLGGTLTNFRTIRTRLKRLEELEKIRESEEIRNYSKKAQSTLNREYAKIYRNLNGMREMNRLPECLVIVDPTKEKNAVHEAKLLGIKVVALIDTDSDPDMVDLPIPGNDDSLRSIRLIMQHLSDAIKQGRSLRPEDPKKKDDGAEETYKAVPSIRD